jgi:uroporphyrinogen decarboxylase
VDDYLINRLGYTREQITPDFAALQKRQTLFDSVGLVNLLGGITGGVPFDSLCAGRGMAKFYADLRRMPDKIEAVLNVMADEMAADTKNFLEAAKPFCVVCVPCVRANAGFVNRKTFERFGWPLFKRFTDVAINAGSKVLFHMDARWTEFLDFFTDFPKGTCIFDPDGMTDIFAIKRTLGDRMCITGDVSAAMLVVATPEEVYRYSRKLIEEIGPEGFILSSGCSVPPNAKPENVEALVAAAEA